MVRKTGQRSAAGSGSGPPKSSSAVSRGAWCQGEAWWQQWQLSCLRGQKAFTAPPLHPSSAQLLPGVGLAASLQPEGSWGSWTSFMCQASPCPVTGPPASPSSKQSTQPSKAWAHSALEVPGLTGPGGLDRRPAGSHMAVHRGAQVHVGERELRHGRGHAAREAGHGEEEVWRGRGGRT